MNRVRVDAHRPLPAAEVRALSEVYIQQRLGLPTLCELTFRAPPGPLTTALELTPGVPLRVSLEEQRQPLFVGEVTAVEQHYAANHEQVLHVRGYDRLHRLRKRQSARAFTNITVAQLARTLAQDLGLTVQATENGPPWPHLFQHHQSDLALLTETAALAGLYVSLREQTLHLLTLAGSGEVIPLTLGDNLLEARIELNSDAVCDTVTATGWNPLRVEAHTGRARVPRTGRRLRSAGVTAQQVGGTGRYELINEGVPDGNHATALAQAELDYRTATAVTLAGLVQGHPAFQPGVLVQVAGVAPAQEGRYVLTAVTHTIDQGGVYVCEINTAPPSPVSRPRTDVATLGIITNIGDSGGLGRVKAQLPAYNGIETDWMGVLMPGAGANKGFIALPAVGDTVLVLLTHENPGQGIVLGGLYGTRKPPDSGVTGSNVHRYTWVTPDGQQIQLNSRGDVIRLQNAAGSYIELAGGDITIAGRAIDFQRT